MDSTKQKYAFHSDISHKENLLKNLMIDGVPSRDNRGQIIRMIKYIIFQNEFLPDCDCHFKKIFFAINFSKFII